MDCEDQRMKNQMATSTTAGIPNSQPKKYLPMLDLPFVNRLMEFRVSVSGKARARTSLHPLPQVQPPT
jgi:hypothetical protein